MDTQLIKTFLAVVSTESFVAASQRINVTQSTISQRIQKLEDILGHQLFVRSKSGVELTVNGAKFEPYARSMQQLFDEAAYQTSLPEKFTGNLFLGCEDSLWPELSANWLTQLSRALPQIAISFQTGDPQAFSNLLLRGLLDMAVVYMPIVRPGFRIEHILDDRLVMVSATPNHTGEIGDDYVYANWGQAFAIAHSRWFPNQEPPQLQLQLGSAIARYIIRNGHTAYLPYRVADDYVASGQLHFVKGAPEMPYPSYAVWTENKPKDLLDKALQELRIAAQNAPWIELDT